MSKYLLEIQGITKQLNAAFKLDDIHLNLRQQEVHILMGANGAGKSALVKIMSGVITEYTGSIFLNDSPIIIHSIEDAKAHGIFYVPQEIHLFNKMTVAENLFFETLHTKHKLSPINMNEICFKAKELFKEFQVNIDPLEMLGNYGLAQKHIIQILKAYVSNAKVIILDEPSAAFTDYENDILHSIITKLKHKYVGIFLISHKLNDICKLGDRVSIIKDGRLIATLDVNDSIEEELILLLAGMPLSNKYPKLHFKKGAELLKVCNLKSSGILTDISFCLHKHEVLGITGLAGSGRTLLANCLFGNTEYECTSLEINGSPVHIRHPFQAIANSIALLPEDREADGIISSLNVADNIAFTSLRRFSHLCCINYNILLSAVKEYLSRFNISSNTYTRLNYYTTGHWQKMSFIKWIMNHSKIFIIDEPTRGVDIVSKVDIYNCINNITKNGGGVILISSDFDEIIGMCDRILVLSQGKLVCEMTQKEATKAKILHHATTNT
ncbi:sugar ABC transporter ATP-binding protein [Cellulosilyticum sp. I15G10I2]|uniref:sugar ABC transporter ATP-binding protein n=1 Tax=Cellulosilyticum sp. I15G10I2 TaxID=1892843 RepID=UPI00085C6B49|nr:sugar ABC transporter ATP-binding protein [Cellulosilyticum sp. I15G10I2]